MASFALGAGSGLKPKAAPVEIKPAKPYEERIKYPIAFLKKFQEVRTVPAAGRRTRAHTLRTHPAGRLCRVARPETPGGVFVALSGRAGPCATCVSVCLPA